MSGKRLITGQLALGDAEVTTFALADILAKINAAKLLTGMNRVLLQPSGKQQVTQKVLEHCRSVDIEVYLWHKTLADNRIIPEEDELLENAWGQRGVGRSGIFPRIFEAEENLIFACPRNSKYNDLVRNRCAQQLEHFDGLFMDNFGFPLPSLGMENFFSCFCPVCLDIEPRLKEWRNNVRELREYAASASNADLERWGTMRANLHEFGLDEFHRFRSDSVNQVAASYADIARNAGKAFALDLVSPAVSWFAGHDYPYLSRLADWVKPRIYFRVFGPSNLPVECYSVTMGLVAWGNRYTIPGVLHYIERSTKLKMPTNVHSLAQNYLTDDNVMLELNQANIQSASPVHPGFECSLHPDYNTGVDETSIKNFLSFTKDNPGLVLCWNLLYVPDHFLKEIGDNL